MANQECKRAMLKVSRRRFFAAASAGAAAGLAGAKIFGDDPAPTPIDPAAIKVLTCNIRLPLPEDDAAGNGWSVRRKMCADVMNAQRAELIGLQECREEQLAYLLSEMPGWQAVGLGHPDLSWSRVNAILFAGSRFELRRSGGFWLSETPHVEGSKSWDSARARFVNWAHLADKRTGGELRVWNIHLDHIGHTAREKSAAMIAAASAALPASLPQLLIGDFNAGSNQAAIKALKSAGWQDTYAAKHGPDDPGFTAHRFLGPARSDAGPHGGKIDWIFCRDGARILAADIIRDGREGRFPSDHYFVSATVVLPKP